MCGIVGVIAKTEKGLNSFSNMPQALKMLSLRGPDFQATKTIKNVCFGHARLSIIDTSEQANQPFIDVTERYTLTFNGEIYNYKALKIKLEQMGFIFKTQSDTEVLLNLFIAYREKCVEFINGFFAFAIFDNKTKEVYIFRDRIGIKPLVFYDDEDKFIFASETKAISAFSVKKEINHTALFTYLQLQYIPAPKSICSNFSKLTPGEYLKIETEEIKVSKHKYYQIPYSPTTVKKVTPANYNDAKKQLKTLLQKSVERRLVADVEVGGFLSGGIDSSVIAIEAKKQNANFKTFSIGFPDEPFFDETKFAKAVAQKHNIEHEVFEISNQDLFENLHNVLDYLDEPFGDSSALPVYILSKLTSKQIKVALSGDGADEMFGGYNKHYAEYNALNRGFKGLLAKAFSPIGKLLPQGRNNKLLNLNRKLLRFNKGQKMPRKSRYWLWASICNEEEANYYLNERLIIKEQRLTDNAFEFKKLKDQFTKHITKQGTLNEVLYADMHMVLPNDMLTKVDLMSMANSLEVRTPFLDHELVEFAFTLPSAFKINSTIRKKILQETYKEELPEILFKRPKQGFEVPLLKWFQTELKSKIENFWLEKSFVAEQGIFNPEAISDLKKTVFSSNPKDSVATTWDLIVFQNWYKKNIVS